MVSIAAGTLAGWILPESLRFTTRFLIAWNVVALLYVGLAWAMMARSSPQAMRDRADVQDDGAIAVLILTVAAAVASLAAIAAELAGIRASGEGQTLRLTLAGTTILCSWFFVHTVFAIHYAHDYYADGGRRGGLAFPHDREPDYGDFLYFSFTIGSAAQTSDVTILSRSLRRLALAHTVLSFLFNTTILALAINVGAGLI